jgi:Domain of unknown function (DUF1707)
MASDETGRRRASHADREQAVELLKAAFVQGRLDKHEFDARVGQAFASRTYLELAAVTADIPPDPIPAKPVPARPVPAQPQPNRGVRSGLAVMAVGTGLAAFVWAVALITENPTALLMALTITLAYAGTLMLAGAVMIESRPRKRGRPRRLSRPPLGQVGIRPDSLA